MVTKCETGNGIYVKLVMVPKCEASKGTYIFQLIEMPFPWFNPLHSFARQFRSKTHTHVLYMRNQCVQLDSRAITILCQKHADHT